MWDGIALPLKPCGIHSRSWNMGILLAYVLLCRIWTKVGVLRDSFQPKHSTEFWRCASQRYPTGLQAVLWFYVQNHSKKISKLDSPIFSLNAKPTGTYWWRILLFRIPPNMWRLLRRLLIESMGGKPQNCRRPGFSAIHYNTSIQDMAIKAAWGAEFLLVFFIVVSLAA